MGTSKDQNEDTRKRLTDLIDYVEHMVRLSEKAVFALGEYRQLAYHEAVLKGRTGIRHDQSDEDGPVWLSIDRLKRINPPNIPEQIQPWITVAADPFTEPIVETIRAETIPKDHAAELIEKGTLKEEDVQLSLQGGDSGDEEKQSGLCDVIFRLRNLPDIEADVRAYVERHWREWAEAEKPRRETIKIYDDFFSLQQSIQSMDGEQGLEMVWGMGMARWRLEDGHTIDHPLVEQLVEIDTDTMSGRIHIRPRSTEPQVPLKPFFALDNHGADRVHAFAKKFFASFAEDQDLSPYNSNSFEPILRQAAVSLHGEARYHPDDLSDITDRKLPPIDKTLRVTNTWVVFARQRSDNFYINDLEQLKNAVEKTEELPGPAKRLVTPPSNTTAYTPSIIDIGPTAAPSLSEKIGGGSGPPPPEPGIEATRTDQFFFPKPFNDDQISIIRRLQEADGVVVQGPPGTGKTHTIANIICHYLATGRRVLVTSKGEAALTVLRDHIPRGIRDLTISLLTNERAGLKQLEQAVTVLSNTATQINPRDLERDINAHQERVGILRKKIKETDHELNKWATHHLKKIGPGGGILPIDLAQKIVGDRDRHSWFPDHPGPEAEYDPRFTDEDIAATREARKALGENLQYLGRELPNLADLPDVAIITAIHEDLINARRLEAEVVERNVPVLSLSAERAVDRAGKLEEAVEGTALLFKDLEDAPWLLTLVKTWRDKSTETSEVQLFGDLLPTMMDLAKRRQAVVGFAVTIPKGADGNDDLFTAVKRAEIGSRPFGLVPIGKSETREVYAQLRIKGHKPDSTEEWKKVVETLKWRRDIATLTSHWKVISVEFDLPPLDNDVDKAGRWLSGIVRLIQRIDSFLNTDRELIATEVPDLFPYGMLASDILGSRQGAENAAEIIRINLSKNRLIGSRDKIGELLQRLAGCSGPIVDSLKAFVTDSVGDSAVAPQQITIDWQVLCRQLSAIRGVRPRLDTIYQVAKAIEESGAPEWANLLRTTPVTGNEDLWTPGDWLDAWNWRRRETYLKQIDGRDQIRTLCEQRIQYEDDLRKTFHKVVENRTFLSLKKSMTEQVESALVMFTSAIRRIGKGTGIRSQRFRRDARTAMDHSYAAVPCWIMPTWRISESLPAVLGSFDLVIVDEASQSDITALPALVRGKKVLIVGDDKQVSPTGAFVEERRLLQLKHNFLRDQPFAPLVLPGGSLYDLANAVFPGRRIMLHEHFRCVEPIIRFSMQFYTEPIIPLRIPKASERLDPPLIDVHIPHGQKSRGQINVAEADAIVDEIATITADPAFDGRSIGVISLIGHQQAHYIETKLLSRIGEDTYVLRDITCGNPATFQGKERDIMFISMVESSQSQSARTALLWEQRFNVAFSRARDRMYLFRSVDEEELKPDDLKARAIRHFKSPMESAVPEVDDLIELCESGFEREVFRRLSERGYRVTPQVRVAGYFIDMVVEGDRDRRLAIELDGDKYHTPEVWADDLFRQRTLERMGWQFWRCWGSSFYLDPDACMVDLIRSLDARGIKPLGGETPRNVYTEHRVIGEPQIELPDVVPEAKEQREPTLGEATAPMPTPPTKEKETGLELPAADTVSTLHIAAEAPAPTAPAMEVGAEYKADLVESGDRVLIAYNDQPGFQLTIRISDTEHDPDMRIIRADYPLAQVLLGTAVDEEVEIPAGGSTRIVTVVRIEKKTPLEPVIVEPDPADGPEKVENALDSRKGTEHDVLQSAGGDSGPFQQNMGLQSILPYNAWHSHPLPDPRETPLHTIVKHLEEIIEAEGPVVLKRVFHLYAGAAGIKRVGNQLRKLFLRTSEAAIKSGRIEDEQGGRKLSLDSVVRRAGIQRVLLRKRGPRDFEEIPPSEIAEMYRSIVAAHLATDKETLYRQVLYFYDLKRFTSNVRRSLDQIASEAN